MAGAGFKTFNTGDVLLASEVNTYLMQQTVMVFDDATARSTALPTPSEGMYSYLKDTNLTYRYDGSAWLSDAGTTSPLTTKGDLWGYSTADARIPVGANGTVLTADSGEALGVKWGAASSGALTLISRVDFSNVATQDFDNVFTSTYRTYMVVVEKIYAATATDDGHLQLRSAGPTTKTSGYYQQSFKWTSTAASTSSGGGSEIGFADDMGTTTDYVSGIFWINGVGNTSEQCNVRMQFSNPYGSYLYEGTAMATSGTFTGFRLKSSSSNITGRVAIYGMAV